jgi:hypothetical protein
LTYSSANVGGQTEVSPLSVILADGKVERPELGGGDPIDAFAAELNAAACSVEQGVVAPTLSGLLARQALVLCHTEVESVRRGQAVEVH